MPQPTRTRRDLLTGLGAGAIATGALGTTPVTAQAVPATPSTPVMHAEDAWMSAMPGKHRVVLDVISAERVGDGLRFASNILNGHKSGYGLDDADLAVIICLRHGATPYGFDNAFWAKNGKIIDAEADPVPTANPYSSGGRTQFSDLTKRGVHFMVCGMASRGLAGRIAGQGGDADAVLKDMATHLLPNAVIVPAGVIGVTHAQERGFALLYVG